MKSFWSIVMWLWLENRKKSTHDEPFRFFFKKQLSDEPGFFCCSVWLFCTFGPRWTTRSVLPDIFLKTFIDRFSWTGFFSGNRAVTHRAYYRLLKLMHPQHLLMIQRSKSSSDYQYVTQSTSSTNKRASSTTLVITTSHDSSGSPKSIAFSWYERLVQGSNPTAGIRWHTTPVSHHEHSSIPVVVKLSESPSTYTTE